MHQDAGLSLTLAGWLATGNYAGYLVGALACIARMPFPARAIRWGLFSVGLTTLGMGLFDGLPLWLILRFLSGAASAFVLVGTSAWAMPILARHGREEWSGHVFSGVGIGITFAGLLGLTAGIELWGSRSTWIALGLTATGLALVLWRPLAADRAAGATATAIAPGQQTLPRGAIVAAVCYAAFGFGYIIPATFLPALARGYIDNPVMFGLVWPVFGATAAFSTFASARLGRNLPPRQLWMGAKWVLAAGVLAPALDINVATLLLSAACVGGTFMIITMAGIKEALRLGGACAPLAVGVMTAAFAAGQILGPLVVSLLGRCAHAFALASFVAVAGLVASNCVLMVFADEAKPA